jgi:hypothetical protein
MLDAASTTGGVGWGLRIYISERTQMHNKDGDTFGQFRKSVRVANGRVAPKYQGGRSICHPV